MPGSYKVIYSETSRRQIRKLHPSLKPLVKSKIEKIPFHPHIGKLLERELAGYLSLRAKRYRIIYKVKQDDGLIEIHYIGHRKDIYELFGEKLHQLKERINSMPQEDR
ncbi:MAG: type II toxin-antitoxin system RelE/ParE family toxin [Desulfobacterales bacterium]